MQTFCEICGIGVQVDQKEIQQAIASLLDKHRDELVNERYSYPISKLLYSLKEGRMKWADGRLVKDEFDRAIVALLGEETEEDKQKKKKMQGKSKGKNKSASSPRAEEMQIASPLSKEPTTSIADGFVEA